MAAQEDDPSNIEFLEIINDFKRHCSRQFLENDFLKILKSVKEQKRPNIHDFFLNLNKSRIEFKLPLEEVRDIVLAVDEIVDQLLYHLGKVDSAFEISHKYAVGSMAEGTRCTTPNEFDFVAVLKRWSTPGAVKVNRVSQPHRFVRSILNTHTLLREHMSIKFTDSSDNYVQQRNQHYFKYRWYELEIFDKAFTKIKDTVVEKDTGTLSVLDSSSGIYASEGLRVDRLNGPVYCVSVKWKNRKAPVQNMKISIDVAIAIERKGLSSIIQNRDVFHPQYYYKLIRVNRYLLLPMEHCDCKNADDGPTDSSCCQITFTNTEVKLVQSLSDNHKLCLRILKYLFIESKLKQLSSALSSYLLKTCVLMHAVSCRNDSDTFQCIVEILCILHFCVLYNKNCGFVIIPCIFLDSAIHAKRFGDKQKYKIVKNFFFEIVLFFQKIGRSTTYSFEESLSELSKLTAEVRRSVESSRQEMECCNIL